MFLKSPKASTDQRVRSLLQKAARRGYSEIVERALLRLDLNGDKTWLRSRAVVITFEECWPLAAWLSIDRELSSKRKALLNVTEAAKQKDAASLGALAYVYQEGDQSVADNVPDKYILRIVSEAIKRPKDFFEWALTQSRTQQSNDIISAAQRYLAVATWPWDKACILAGAILSTKEIPSIESTSASAKEFPYWIALDKHTPQGKIVLTDVAKQIKSSYRKLIWASFYFESAQVNKLLPSPWWNAEKRWRLNRAGMSVTAAEDLWARANPLIHERLIQEAESLKEIVETSRDSDLQKNLYKM